MGLLTSTQMAVLLLMLLAIGNCTIYDKLYNEAYKITQAMTIDQKIGQTLQVDFSALTGKSGTDQALALKYFLGSVLIAGDGVPDANGNIVDLPIQQDKIKLIYLNGTVNNWQTLANKFNQIGPEVTTAEGKTFRIKLLLGTDAVHSNQHVIGTILFPHNSGLACTHNANNFYNLGYWTGVNVKNSGFNYAFAPTVAVSHNPQWGRFYESMGQDDSMIAEYAKQFVKGLQNIDTNGTWKGVLGSVKHFFGDGSTIHGADEGNARVINFKSYVNHNIQGYKGAVSSEVGSVMCSYSAINGIPMAVGGWMNNQLRYKLGFDGFIISDYDQMHRIFEQGLPTSFLNVTGLNTSMSTMMNAGIDMFMLPGDRGIQGILQYFNYVKMSIKNNTISIARLDDAATRILAVKMAMGLTQQLRSHKYQSIEKQSSQHLKAEMIQQNPVVHPTTSANQYDDALQAARESLVLLKNDNKLLPIKGLKSGSIEYIVLVGERVINVNHLSKNILFRNFDNIGMQCGGWTIRWQGFEGNDMWRGNGKDANATSILDSLGKVSGSKYKLVYPNYTTLEEQTRVDIEREQFLNTELKNLKKNMHANNTIIIGVLGESPYAEVMGDVGIPYCKGSILGGDGCLYDPDLNPYLPQNQRTSLELEYEKFDHSVITSVREADKNIPLLTILVSGRPMLINNVTNTSSAIISAWLPGTTGGQAIVDSLTGDYIFRAANRSEKVNTLAFDWPSTQASMYDFPIYPASGEIPTLKNPLYTVGYGLSTA